MDPGSQTQGVDALVSDIFGNDDEPEVEAPAEDHKGIIDDIFGGDSDGEISMFGLPELSLLHIPSQET